MVVPGERLRRRGTRSAQAGYERRREPEATDRCNTPAARIWCDKRDGPRIADSVIVGKVESHATDAMVDRGRVRREDKDGHDAAGIAADFGRLRQSEMVIDVS